MEIQTKELKENKDGNDTPRFKKNQMQSQGEGDTSSRPQTSKSKKSLQISETALKMQMVEESKDPY